MVISDTVLVTAIDKCMVEYLALFRKHNAFLLSRVRDILLRFLQDHRVKISVFLAHGLQLPNGVIIPRHDGYLPTGADVPGVIRYFRPSTLSCACLSRIYGGMMTTTGSSKCGVCSASYSSSASARGGSADTLECLDGEDVETTEILRVSSVHQQGNKLIFNHGESQTSYSGANMMFLPHSGVALSLPVDTPILTSDRLCRLGENLYIIPVPATAAPEPESAVPEPAPEAEAEEAEAETEDPLLSVLSGLPSIDNANDNAFLLDNLFGSDEDAIRKQKDFKDNFIGAHDGSGIDTRAAAMFGAGEDESDGDEDLLALMDMAADM
jgi:hypothetical protein